ncbi:unnamed protein product [Trifolium pratense]|uniref:Uncharacterized protein n=1 Tax=Trifolium pratense TaxID=57577 RepID=A0ACB0IRW0_TRIPR|nr:unnamed protein product [Trifolium pratense]
MWNGSQVELLKLTIDEMIKRSCETFKDDGSSIGVSSEVTLSKEHEATVVKRKRLIDMVDSDLVVHSSTNFPFLMHNLDIKVRPFIAAFVNRMRRSTTAVELLGNFLAELKEMVETQMKRSIRNVVLTVPVSLSRLQINWIHCACVMAGLKVIRLMPQPTAVALWYAQQQLQASASSHENMDNESKKIALIFNMDAGYCDVAVIAATANGKCRIKALIGSTIGGEDFLRNMMRHLLPDSENIFKKHVHKDGEIKSMALFRCGIQKAITRLSSQTHVEVDLDLGYGLKICKAVTQDEFEKVNKAMTGVIALGVDNPFGNLEVFDFSFTPLAIGIRANGNNFVPVIPNNTLVPTMRHVVFTTIHDKQAAALITVYEGDAQKAEENHHLMEYFKITDIPEASKGVPEIHVRMDLDHKNRLLFLK